LTTAPTAHPESSCSVSNYSLTKRPDNLPGFLCGASGLGAALGLKGVCCGSLGAERKDLF